jgi:hypothetical protein
MEDSDKEQELIHIRQRMSDLLNMAFSKDYINSISKLKRYFIYIFVSLFMFFIVTFFVIKNILFLNWYKIPSELKALGYVDEAIRSHLEM